MNIVRQFAIAVLCASALSACGNNSGGGGPVVIDEDGADVGTDATTTPDARTPDDGDAASSDVTPDAAHCDHECTTDGAARCDGEAPQLCEPDADGCLRWVVAAACDDGLFCSGGSCVSQCQDACTTIGARRCESGGAGTVAECALDANGCLAWEPVEACSGTETCSAGQCSEQCVDECTTVNDRACDGEGYKLCGNFDSDSCLEWGDVVPCGDDATCSAGYCAVQCTDECAAAGLTECVPGVAATRTCGNFDSDACLEWGTTSACAAGEVCDPSGGAATCVFDDPCAGVSCNAPPADSCVGADTARSYGAGSCNATGGCDYGYVDTHCPDGCSNGACNAPTCGGTTCNSPPADVCESASRLTRYFPIGACDGSNCSYASSTIVCSEGCFQGACITGSWETELPSLTAVSNTEVDVAFDAAGNPHIGYCHVYSGDVSYRWRDAAGWHDELVDPGLGSGCKISIALDAQGRPMLSYYDPTNDDLRFAQKQGGSWALSLVATSGDVGSAPSVSMSPTGSVVVAFRDVTNGELKLATRTGTTWQIETVGPWTEGSGSPITVMRWNRAGDLHLLAGASVSVANAGGNYNQPQLHLFTRRGTTWSSVLLHPDAFSSRSGLAVAPNGDVVVQAGVVTSLGGLDPMIVLRSDGDQVLHSEVVRSYGNLLYTRPVGVFHTDSMLQVAMHDPYFYRLDDHGYWVQRDGDGASIGPLLRVVWALGDDVERYFHGGWSITTPPQCTPQCSGMQCGSDGCGGVCGTCSGGDSCNPLGQCTAWQYESIDVPYSAGVLAEGTNNLHAFGYDSTDGLIYSTNEHGAWTTVLTGVDDTSTVNQYDFDALKRDSTGALHLATLQQRPTQYGAYDKLEVFHETSTGWASTVILDLFRAPEALSFVIAADDSWHVAFAERSYPAYNGSSLSYVRWENGMATKEVIATPVDPSGRGNGFAHRMNLVVDSAGHAHILWVRALTYTNQVSLRYATNESGSWVDSVVLDPFVLSNSTVKLLIDANDTLHAFYSQSSQPFRYGTLSGTTWSFEDGPQSVYNTQFGLDPSGTPFYAVGATGQVEIRRRSAPGSWLAEALPVFGNGQVVRFLWDDTPNMHVIYGAGSTRSQWQVRHGWK